MFSLFFHLVTLTSARCAFVPDDRADALQGSVRYWQKYLAVDQERLATQERERALKEMLDDPLGVKRYDPPQRMGRSVFNKYIR